MTTCAPKMQNMCDAKYVLKVWLYGITVVAVLGSVGLVFAAGSWKKDIENKVAKIDQFQSQLINANGKLDTILKKLDK